MYRIVNIGIVNASSKFEISSNKQETEFEKKNVVKKLKSFYCLLNYIIILCIIRVSLVYAFFC